MAKETITAKVYNISDFFNNKEVKQDTVVRKNKSPATVVHIGSSNKTENKQFTFDLDYSTKNSSSFEKETVKEDFKQIAMYSQKIEKFLKTSARHEVFCSPETIYSVQKAFNKDSFSAKKSDAYIIEFERPIGANISKDRNFHKYLSSIFGRESLDYKTERTSRYSEKASFSIKGNDVTLMKKIKAYALKLAV